eukprot:TRINITY_DN17382_c0_g1_i1.p1 TRINITY_DN17382_c0_g1~~TRINITY_DN17382_c0_g1_i1.p1  ORF type:complete len:261 (+),score=55.90 TRINITY_DN17382_c0_g1_i1:253-1035(+)
MGDWVRPAQAHQLMREGACCLDIRPDDCFERERVHGAVARLSELQPGQAVVVCGAEDPTEDPEEPLHHLERAHRIRGGYGAYRKKYAHHCVVMREPGTGDGGSRPTEVIAGKLWLGNRHHARNVWQLRKLGITHVLNATREGEVPCFAVEEIEYLRVNAFDSNDYPLQEHFDLAHNFMCAGERVLVHCHSGHSRSCALVCMHLIRLGLFGDPHGALKEMHPGCHVNKGFTTLLEVEVEQTERCKELGVSGEQQGQQDDSE